MKQILLNLASNAVKYTEKGHVDITINSGTNDELHISITDAGIGIVEEEMPYLFEPFMQVGTTLTKKHEGTGLGLFLTKNWSRC